MVINPNSFEFQLLLGFSICLLTVKILLILYLGRQIYRRTKKEGFNIDLNFGTFI